MNFADASQATLTVLGGMVAVIPNANGSPRAGASGDTLVAGDRVVTADPGAALLTFFDGSEQELGPETEVLLQSLGQTSGGGLMVQIAQASGVTLNRIAHLGENSTYQVQTPNTTSLVRGTRFQATVTLDAERKTVVQEQLAVQEGVVEVRLRSETRRLNPGDQITIVPTAGGLEIVGGEPTLTASQNGTVHSWGDNYRGNLGDGTTERRLTPVQVVDLGGVVAIDMSPGDSHALALRSDGTVWGWGWASSGQLGSGTDEPWITRPLHVVGIDQVTAIAAGSQFSVALKRDGTVWAWGINNSGELGNGSTEQSAAQVQVAGLDSVVAISAHDEHSLALKSDGSVWSWGSNHAGQLGTAAPCTGSGSCFLTTPIQVAGLGGVTAISTGDAFSLALKSDGTVWGWGSHLYSELGVGRWTSVPYTSPVQVLNLGGVVAIAAGDRHALAIRSDGTVWGWGSNQYGQLGPAGLGDEVETPIQVPEIDQAVSIATGWSHTLVIRADGTVWGWGDNEFGMLGNGTTTASTSPVQVSGLNGVTMVTASLRDSAALRP